MNRHLLLLPVVEPVDARGRAEGEAPAHRLGQARDQALDVGDVVEAVVLWADHEHFPLRAVCGRL